MVTIKNKVTDWGLTVTANTSLIDPCHKHNKQSCNSSHFEPDLGYLIRLRSTCDANLQQKKNEMGKVKAALATSFLQRINSSEQHF